MPLPPRRWWRGRWPTTVFGDVLAENRPMLKLCDLFAFTRSHGEDPGVIHVTLRL